MSFADGAALSTPLRGRIRAAVEGTGAVTETVGPGAAERSDRTRARDSESAESGDSGDVFARGDSADVGSIDEGDLGAVEFAARRPVANAAGTDAADTADDLEHADPEAAVDQLLDWLAANNYLSETRFVESRVNARSRKQGTLRIKLELSRHGLALEPEQAATLRETEFARAQALWQRKFGEVATDARLRAKQARFLAARGFAADVVRRVVGGEEGD